MAQRQGRYTGTAEAKVLGWIGEVTGRAEGFERDGNELQACLKSGVALCELVNELGAKPPIKPSKKDKSINQRENITQFVAAAKKLGLKDHETFDTNDLYDGFRLSTVELCLKNLGTLAYTLPSYTGVCLGNPPKPKPAGSKKPKGASSSSSSAKVKEKAAAAQTAAPAVAAAGTSAADQQTMSDQQAEIRRLQRDLDDRSRELDARDSRIKEMEQQLKDTKIADLQQSSSRSARSDDHTSTMRGSDFSLDTDGDGDELERLLMESDPANPTPRHGHGADQWSQPHQQQQQQDTPPPIGLPSSGVPCQKCSRLEEALQATEQAVTLCLLHHCLTREKRSPPQPLRVHFHGN